MEKLSETQLTLAMLGMAQKEGTLLAVQTAVLLQAIQQNNFQQALKEYEPLLERLRFLGGILLRVSNTTAHRT
jgi:polyphosphate kinase